MRNILASITCCFIILCAGCNSDSTKSNENIVSDSTQSISRMNLMLCYALQNEKDTVSLNLVLVGDHVAGKLMYHYFEKDKNIGTLAGEKIGDTVFAKYTFMSEGLESQRYVSFLIKGDQAIEGYAPLNEKSGEPDFSDHSKIQFDNKFVLQKTDCK
jgi:hypothetical protein